MTTRNGYYCEDCDIILTGEQYGEHNVDHTLRRIEWDFTVSEGKPE